MIDNGKPASNYCYEHEIFFEGSECPDCKLESWDEFMFNPQPEDTLRSLEHV